ncbi:MAG: OHCU decarboxylase [Rhizobiales bacterium 65-9]|nr:allantoinase PuuE [Hyphomicrobiales bacterium]OJY35680.1 MAG: OHCU decarboxylase [Rhizobiales bacterium 65-9]
MQDSTYPRDMVGYGRNPPRADWPGGAAIAVQFVINYEEGGENNILHGDKASEAFLSEIVGAQPWPGQRHMNLESIYEYGSRAGFWRLWRMFTERDMACTVYGVATAMEKNLEAVAAMKAARWEIASHGYKWIDYKDVAENEERRHIAEAVRIHEALTGEAPLGFYQGRTSENTLRLTLEEPRFLYSSDAYADDLPYWIEGPRGAHLIVPYTLDANDMRFASPQGFNSGDQFFAYLKDSFDTLHDEGLKGAPKMLSIGLHCRLVGRPGRAASLARFMDYVKGHERAWICTRADIARHWVRRHRPASLTPSRMSRPVFVAAFGDIFEHTPEIADATHRAGLNATHDSAEGLHAAMARQLDALKPDAQLALVNAHPDLAGRLAQAKLLTADSLNEQASAGLDRLTFSELQRFTELNDAYREKFGFPFIIAVRGLQRSDILAAFEKRVGNDREAEMREALAQIAQIALLRLKDRLP